MVFQSYTLCPWLTVAQNIAFGLRERAVAPDRQREIVDIFVQRTGLRGFEGHLRRPLSGGMQQRTAIARALANDPDILLMDEPFGALDNQTRALVQELLLDIWERDRKTVLFVTHDIEEAIFMASRERGHDGPPGPHQDRRAGRPASPAPLHREDAARVQRPQGSPEEIRVEAVAVAGAG